MEKTLPQVGAPDPELDTSPILDEAEFDERAPSADLDIEHPVCHFNSQAFASGSYVQSGGEVLHCERGVWVRKGEIPPV